MNTSAAKTGGHVPWDHRAALHEMLVASLTLAKQIGDVETGDAVMEALRTLHRDELPHEESADVGGA